MTFIQSIKDYFSRVREYYLGSRLSKGEGDSIFPNHLQRIGRTTNKELQSPNDKFEKVIDAEVIEVKRLK